MSIRTRVSVIAAIAALWAPSAAVAWASPAAPEVAAPAAPVEFAPDDPAFYTVPDPLPAGNHGDLIRFQVIDTGFTTTYRIMYLSQTVAGAPTVVTGLVAADEDAAPFGGYPLLLHAHGTIGLADVCSPSMSLDNDIADSDASAEFESYAHATSDGWVVVSTDYEGLGGPGQHPMLVGVSEGRSILDAGLAARQLPGVYVGTATALAGFSQGGHAALWAAQLAPEWTPQQPILATAIGAPASEVAALASWASSDPALSALTVGIVAGLATTYPEASAALGDVLTSSGSDLIGLWDSHCFSEQLDVQGPFVSHDPSKIEPFASLMAANTAGTVAVPGPLLMFHSDADERVPFAHSDALLARLCAAGQVVERRVLTGVMHGSADAAVHLDGVDWLKGVTDGTVVPSSSCLG